MEWLVLTVAVLAPVAALAGVWLGSHLNERSQARSEQRALDRQREQEATDLMVAARAVWSEWFTVRVACSSGAPFGTVFGPVLSDEVWREHRTVLHARLDDDRWRDCDTAQLAVALAKTFVDEKHATEAERADAERQLTGHARDIQKGMDALEPLTRAVALVTPPPLA